VVTSHLVVTRTTAVPILSTMLYRSAYGISGIAFSFQHSGQREGTIDDLPFGTPNRNDGSITGGNNPAIANEFEGMPGAKLVVSIGGKNTLVGGLEGILANDPERVTWYRRLVNLTENIPIRTEYMSEWQVF
jgi:hypothetical protein